MPPQGSYEKSWISNPYQRAGGKKKRDKKHN
jgi:hypothetical protein